MTKSRRWRWWVLAGLLHAGLLFGATRILLDESGPETTASPDCVVSIELPRDQGCSRTDENYERQELPKNESDESEEPAIFFPEAGKSHGMYGSMGAGGGGGYSARYSGRSNIVARGGNSKEFTSYIRGEGGGFRCRADETIVIERPTEPRAAQEGTPRGGELKAKFADKLVPIPLKHTDVKAQVSISLASVTVKQQYHNPYDSKIEAVYVFPLPDDAAVRDFIMVVGDRTIRGMIREREEARKVYEEERRQGHVASLMTQERDNVFTQSVANIEPGKQIDIDITYFHSLKYEKGEYEFHFPMVVGPRYNPPGSTNGVGAIPRGGAGISGQATEVEYLAPDEIAANDITLAVDIDAGLPIEKLESPSHLIHVERPEKTRAKVTLKPNDRIPNKDFVLRYRVGGKGIASALAAHKDPKGGYFTVVVQPPDSLEDVPAGPREMFFVLDVSGSMSGAPIEISKRTMERCLRRLAPTDTFQIVAFASSADLMSPSPLAATPENIKKAMAYVHAQYGSGGTEMLKGIEAALEAPRDPERYRIVSFMTDGYIGNETEIFAAVRRSVGDARIFAFGIGSSVNRYLIEGLGRIGRGTTAFVGLDESSEKAVNGLYQRIEHPALTDIKLEWNGAEISDVYPSTIPDLFVGKPVVITGRFNGAGLAELTLNGKIAGKDFATKLKLNVDEPGLRHAALPAVWARSRIASLSDKLFFTSDGSDFAGEIRATAIAYGLLSQYTAFVAVDSSRVTEGSSGTTVPVPVQTPAGVKYETTVPDKK